ncbi:MAG: metal-dependent transcriptional regulator [Bryobacteraceae bacterium]|nr:metal-dependent transcriptional regulator [Bryobacteraceae bacterium]
MKITISKENYLKAILEAEAEGEAVIAATLARWLRVSAPAVTMAIRRLKRDGLISLRKTGEISLTPSGRDIAGRLFARHQLIERMLTEIFGMEWYKVHDEAEQLEHAVSADFENLLVAHLGDGGFCPHGNRMGLESPEERRGRGWLPLIDVAPESRVEVMSVFERDRPLLEYLDRLAVRPGSVLEVLAHNIDETVSLRVGGAPVHLGRGAAAKVWVKPAASDGQEAP